MARKYMFPDRATAEAAYTVADRTALNRGMTDEIVAIRCGIERVITARNRALLEPVQ